MVLAVPDGVNDLLAAHSDLTEVMTTTHDAVSDMLPRFSAVVPLLLASAVSGGLTLVGVVYLILRSRARALRWFRRSILASIRASKSVRA